VGARVDGRCGAGEITGVIADEKNSSLAALDLPALSAEQARAGLILTPRD